MYSRGYAGLYCVGCEDFYLDKDLVRGLCPDHGTAPKKVEEENFFFRLSAYQERLERLIESNEIRIVPTTRKNEVLRFIRSGLQDISISRSSERSGGWGIPVPEDPSQVIYVWIDALINYLTGQGFGKTTSGRGYGIPRPVRSMSSAKISGNFMPYTGLPYYSLQGCRFLTKYSFMDS